MKLNNLDAGEVAGKMVPGVTNHFRTTAGYLDSFKMLTWRSNKAQHSEEVLIFKPLPFTNGPQSSLCFIHKVYLLTFSIALKGH